MSEELFRIVGGSADVIIRDETVAFSMEIDPGYNGGQPAAVWLDERQVVPLMDVMAAWLAQKVSR